MSEIIETNFTETHLKQFETLSEDLRFYAEQRFKIAQVFLISMGFLVNVAYQYQVMSFGMISIIVSYLCLSWEKSTKNHWYSLFNKLKELELLANENSKMNLVYNKLNEGKKSKLLFSPSKVISSFYYLSMIGWTIYIVVVYPKFL